MTTIEAQPDNLPPLPHPNLLFDAAELQRLRSQRSNADAEQLFQSIVDWCAGWMDPKSPEYPDWQTLKDPRWRERKGLSFVIGRVESCSFLFAMTNDNKWGEFAEALVFTVIRKKLADNIPPGWRHNAGHDFGHLSYALAVFYDLCYELLTSPEREEFIVYAQENLRLAQGMATEIESMALNNRGARCAMGNAMLALAIYQDGERALVRNAIIRGLRVGGAWATYALGIDGDSFEGATYCITTSIMLATFGRACARRGLRDLSRHSHYARMPDFILYNLVPGHDQLLPINDCPPDLLPTGPLVASTINRNGVHLWLYKELRRKLVLHGWAFPSKSYTYLDYVFHDPTLEPISPREAGYPLSKHFGDHGVASMLSSWDSDAAQMLFFCGRQGYRGHRQEDQNSFTFCALGEKFAWDAGYDDFSGVYKEGSYEQWKNRGTDVHNAVLVDGVGQNGFDNYHWPRGHIVEFRDAGRWTYVLGDASRCYGIDGVIRRADRHVFFHRGQFPYAVIVDDVAVDDSEHDITWNFVAHPDTRVQAEGAGNYAIAGVKSDLILRVVASHPVEWRQDMAGRMPRLQATQRAKRARFATLLLPRWPKLETFSFTAEFHEARAEVAVTLGGKDARITFDLGDRSRGEQVHFDVSGAN